MFTNKRITGVYKKKLIKTDSNNTENLLGKK